MFIRLTLLLALALGGCALPGLPKDGGGYKTVGLIVPAFQTLRATNIGFVGGGGEADFDGASIDLGNRLRSGIKTLLAPRYQVADLPDVPVPHNYWSAMTVADYGLKAVEAAVAASPVRADLYVVVQEIERNDQFTGALIKLSGCGVLHVDTPIASKPPFAYCSLSIVLVDGTTMKPIGSQILLADSGSGLAPDSMPHVAMEGLVWQGVALPPAQIAAASKALDEVVASSLPYSLRKLGLAP
ncbi:hypothetical protein [Zavarzinia sp.]|uniref:hypothetical protein n=1 Tax=Zavarzinia sp. TaxID=2027920 RepID=UPI0035694381